MDIIGGKHASVSDQVSERASNTWYEDGYLMKIEITDKDGLNKEIYYDRDKHTMIFIICDRHEPEYRRNWHRPKLTLEDQMDHEKQLRETGTLVLPPDCVPLVE